MNGAILIDGANVAYSLTKQGGDDGPLRFNHAKFKDAVGRIVSGNPLETVDFRWAIYYMSHRTDEDQARLMPLAEVLEKTGWQVVHVRLKKYPDGTFRDKRTDILMVLDAYQIATQGHIDSLVVATHDSDFAPLFERVPKPIKKYVVGWKHGMSSELRAVATPIWMDDIWNKIRQKNWGVKIPLWNVRP